VHPGAGSQSFLFFPSFVVVFPQDDQSFYFPAPSPGSADGAAREKGARSTPRERDIDRELLLVVKAT
jgi:hypothetical protein